MRHSFSFQFDQSSTLAVLIPPRRATERDVSAFLRRRAVEESHCEVKSAEAESSRRATARSKAPRRNPRGAVEES
ncbi:hypothetical protein F2Q68_00018328 [Brassica cretica]|uniref:Uncharacterized protein n=1 Tax=Brassica cretica TaxID=69181 RepID=A0A8S9HJZ3_BRACR|nr:hypothetical protein F2Q68_00018328 [Brassica cretica]